MIKVGVRAGSARREGQIKGLQRSKQMARYTNTVLVKVYRSESAPASNEVCCWRFAHKALTDTLCISLEYDIMEPGKIDLQAYSKLIESARFLDRCMIPKV
jgi:hypothetical protein